MQNWLICIGMNPDTATKYCTECKTTKSTDEFVHDRRICRKCVTKINLIRLRESKKRYNRARKKQDEWYQSNKKHRNEYDLEWRAKNINRMLLYHAKTRAKKYNVPFNLKLEDIVIPSHCPVLGMELKSGIGNKRDASFDSSPSLDRMNPSLGYVKENVRVISLRANKIKNCGTIEEHQKIIEYMKGNN